MDFQRARSDEQREQRRQMILTTTATMLTEMPVAKLSLNELSRRVGLAKSNVLRYFPSREAILLELLDQEVEAWATGLVATFGPRDEPARDRVDYVASILADSLASRPVMCDLISAQTSVLEQNITVEVALAHKRAAATSLLSITTALRQTIPELNDTEAHEGLAIGLFLVGTAWPHGNPSEALRLAYEADPEVAATQVPFHELMRRGFELAFSGLLARQTASE